MLFQDRFEAGRLLSSRLRQFDHPNDVCVRVLPRDGLPVGFAVAKFLIAPFDVLIVRKLEISGQEKTRMLVGVDGAPTSGIPARNRRFALPGRIGGSLLVARAVSNLPLTNLFGLVPRRRGPAGTFATWESRIAELESSRSLAWRRAPGTPIRNAGIICFQSTNDGGTRVHVHMSYKPAVGAVAHTLTTHPKWGTLSCGQS